MNNNKKKKRFKLPSLYWLYLAVAIFLIALTIIPSETTRTLPYSEFVSAIESGCVSNIKVQIAKRKAVAEIKASCDAFEHFTGQKSNGKKSAYIETTIPSIDEFTKLLRDLKDSKVYTGTESYEEGRDYVSIFLYSVLPFLLLIGFFIWMNRRAASAGSGGAGVFNVGKSKAKIYDKDSVDKRVTFADVAGLEGAKQEVEEIVHFLKNPSKYTSLGGKIPKGALLVGPPGTGKTLLAKAVAGEANVPFFSMSGSDFVEMFVGVGASRVRDLFQQAKEKAPCIVFIDEIDAVGRARSKNNGLNSNDERESTLNQLLTEMDGFGTNSGVIILAATNRADILDKALMRAGRFDRQIHIDLPDLNERKAILGVHLRPIKIDPDIDVEFLARQTPGFSGADLANVCNEAALIAARKERPTVTRQDFLDAVDRIIGGLEKKGKIITAEEKKNIAYHEAGHATISWHLKYADPLVKVTIVPRGQALGAAWYLPEERQLNTKESILDKICSLLGGRAAEEIFFNVIDTGALNDLERATRMAYAMVVYYGMSDTLRNISFYDSTGRNDMTFSKPYSETTAQAIDTEVQRIIDEQYARARDILMRYAEGHNKIAQVLIDKEVLFAEDLKEVFGDRPWPSRSEEILADEEARKKSSNSSENSETSETSDCSENSNSSESSDESPQNF